MSSAMLCQASSKQAVRPSVRPARRTVNVVCQATADKPAVTPLAAAALATALAFGNVDAAKADIAGLTPCAQSKAFAKLQKKEVKGLEKRLKQYSPDSAPALALKATIERTNNRFANYAKAGLLCGTDGLPHLIADPGLALKYGHAGEVFIPTFGFLYVAGWIGYVGRQYIITIKGDKKPTEKEIIIDVPLALKLSAEGAAWPIRTVQELKAGTLTEVEANITVSPR